jgi:hypothetical protein
LKKKKRETVRRHLVQTRFGIPRRHLVQTRFGIPRRHLASNSLLVKKKERPLQDTIFLSLAQNSFVRRHFFPFFSLSLNIPL